ncbi:hypothetical protein L1049_005988 [Liquidambar formosana]|uniref:3'-5' exonuclease domain-containing protein n=1 Tax=Liquidambar formosana TaxID=63359 RepID=A0AAP0RGE4_LIQFO
MDYDGLQKHHGDIYLPPQTFTMLSSAKTLSKPLWLKLLMMSTSGSAKSTVLFADQHKPEDLFVGLDTKYGDTLQLCVNQRCLIFQFRSEVEIPESLVNFLKNPKFTFIGIAIEHDALGKLFVRDSLEELARVCLNKEVKKPKGFNHIDWKAKDLSISQIQYACIDAFLALDLWSDEGEVVHLSYGNEEQSRAVGNEADGRENQTICNLWKWNLE